MRLIVVNGNAVELNYMWLPTWLGQNAAFKRQLEEDLKPQIEGLELTEATLDKVNRIVLDYITVAFPHITGLFDYLDGLKFVNLRAEADGRR